MSPVLCKHTASENAPVKRRAGGFSGRPERALEFTLVHIRPTGNFAALCLRIEFRFRLLPAATPVTRLLCGVAGSLPPLGAFQVLPVLLLAFIFRCTRFMQPDRDRLLRVLHFAAAVGLEFAVLELVHDPPNGFFLLLRLMRRHNDSRAKFGSRQNSPAARGT